jgi:phosphoglycolate phosphatase
VSRLIVFDCDGTLVDSQQLIVEAARQTLLAHDLEPLEETAVRAVIGLSLELALAQLVPAADERTLLSLVATYRATWRLLRTQGVLEPLFPRTREVLSVLDRAGHLLGVATGKSRPGLLEVLDHHGLTALFVSFQTADRHPSKPHPSMLQEAMRETGSSAAETLMVGDTTFDMEMARAAGARAIGVAWGYHGREQLEAAGAELILQDFDQLLDCVRGPIR